MSMIFVDNPDEKTGYEKEDRMYHRIMREGTLDENGYLVSPPSDMTDEESVYYQKLLKERNGRIQYTV